jgi:hypothetical protein
VGKHRGSGCGFDAVAIFGEDVEDEDGFDEREEGASGRLGIFADREGAGSKGVEKTGKGREGHVRLSWGEVVRFERLFSALWVLRDVIESAAVEKFETLKSFTM